jgi:hypothetical protein
MSYLGWRFCTVTAFLTLGKVGSGCDRRGWESTGRKPAVIPLDSLSSDDPAVCPY